MRLGSGISAIAVDASRHIGLEICMNYDAIILCVQLSDTELARRCALAGKLYIDISAEENFLSNLIGLKESARTNGSRLLVGVGAAPGLTNLLASRMLFRHPSTRSLDIIIKFGLADEHGAGALEWMLDAFTREFTVREDDIEKRTKSFSESRDVTLPGSDKPRRGMVFRQPARQ